MSVLTIDVYGPEEKDLIEVSHRELANAIEKSYDCVRLKFNGSHAGFHDLFRRQTRDLLISAGYSEKVISERPRLVVDFTLKHVSKLDPYCVVQDSSVDGLVHRVNELISLGYSPSGGVYKDGSEYLQVLFNSKASLIKRQI